jgi:uncharacterized protein YndB with AHSA1/START domain
MSDARCQVDSDTEERRVLMTPSRRGSAHIEFPNELEVLISRQFDAPIALVFEVMTKPEHVSIWGAYPSDPMTECSVDLRVGGSYRHVFVTEDGTVCAFHGTYLEVQPPIRTVATWRFAGWPDAEAIETWQLDETDGVTTLTTRLAFRDKAGRDHYPATGTEAREMTSSDGPPASFDAMEDILRSLLDPQRTALRP